MTLNLRNIRPLSDFQRGAKALLATLRETSSPIVLTVNGKAAAVVQDAESYQQLIDRMELLESLVGLRKSLEEFETGQSLPLASAFEQLMQKHDISS
ncbi:type II toxin-antitoxin system Phd/YefM family antitoxin [Spirulina major CS-329]|uniref:type II toxin-antitoxin system Phd/YefM family antitoxin n=1 Tax=Spirulina TaxID=1154 RepID=UPI00232C5D80|nr:MULTISPECIES: type II toxin-antitoxin system Phd/YefM family antitoxin [Spirulina]MDB9493675.1 type II toxin-antitoxin system Phd/YefM family antitoxin [Spirulina subsalsa CS-330]MDB9503654.1 type II toxin-antitoxin system Phd/YefM family antitoxin [Spirulina major CS-329]